MSSPGQQTDLRFTVVGSEQVLQVPLRRLVIAGYTARDQAAVQAHIDELAHIGVPPPPRVPMFYEVPAGLATTAPTISVRGSETSGEVEPVLVRSGADLYLGLGSDHTDREVEKRDVAESKASAPKPVSGQVLAFDRAADTWDGIEVTCRLDGEVYQQGRLSAMLHPTALLEQLSDAGEALTDGALMFCGTLPLLSGAFVFGSHYELELTLPDGTSLSHAYDVALTR